MTNLSNHPSAPAVARVMSLYELADEAERIVAKFHGILDQMASERARADTMMREIDGLNR